MKSEAPHNTLYANQVYAGLFQLLYISTDYYLKSIEAS